MQVGMLQALSVPMNKGSAPIAVSSDCDGQAETEDDHRPERKDGFTPSNSALELFRLRIQKRFRFASSSPGSVPERAGVDARPGWLR